MSPETSAKLYLNGTKPDSQPDTFAFDVLSGLQQFPKAIPSKYFYDEPGSRIFEQIMQLPEYYPTRCEAHIFEHHKQTLLELCRQDRYHLVDLGAGDAAKTSILIDHFYQNELPFAYVPVDISTYSVTELEARLNRQYPQLDTRTFAGEYLAGLQWVRQQVTGRKFVLFMGSNIGNFSVEECRLFLLRIWQLLDENDLLLIGFDLKKDPQVIWRAYNDSQGVTAAFNRNLLHRINRELGGNFEPDSFDFYASYDPVSGFVRSYVISRKPQRVYIEALDRYFDLDEQETIHLENSRKFSVREIEELATACGFTVETHLFDDRRYFTDSIWRVKGKESMS